MNAFMVKIGISILKGFDTYEIMYACSAIGLLIHPERWDSIMTLLYELQILEWYFERVEKNTKKTYKGKKNF